MPSGAARWRADGRHILGVKSRRSTLEMKVRPAFQQSDATIPTKNAIVIACGPDFFRFRKTAHGFFHQRQQSVQSVADEQLGLGMAFVQYPGVVKPLIGITQTLK